jgi:hypothetical protein
MGSLLDTHSSARTAVFESFLPAVVVDSGKEIVNPFVKMAGYCKMYFEEHSLVDSFAYMADRLAGNKGFVDFVVGIQSNQSFEVEFGISMVDYYLIAVDSFADQLDLGTSFALSIHY